MARTCSPFRQDDPVPSYRVSLAVGLLKPGVDPVAVLPAAAAAAAEFTTVEAKDLAVLAGQARITVRFQAIDDEVAASIGRTVARRVAELASTSGTQITRRYGARWYPLG